MNDEGDHHLFLFSCLVLLPVKVKCRTVHTYKRLLPSFFLLWCYGTGYHCCCCWWCKCIGYTYTNNGALLLGLYTFFMYRLDYYCGWVLVTSDFFFSVFFFFAGCQSYITWQQQYSIVCYCIHLGQEIKTSVQFKRMMMMSKKKKKSTGTAIINLRVPDGFWVVLLVPFTINSPKRNKQII